MIYKPDTLRTPDRSQFPIVLADEIGGFKQVTSLSDLYAIPDSILSKSKGESPEDAIGQIWYVAASSKRFELISWENRRSASGWQEVNFGGSQQEPDLTEVNQRITDLQSTLATRVGELTALIAQAVEESETGTRSREQAIADTLESFKRELENQIQQVRAEIPTQDDSELKAVIMSYEAYSHTQKDNNTIYLIENAAGQIYLSFLGTRKIYELIDSLTSGASDAALSALQGRNLYIRLLACEIALGDLLETINPFKVSTAKGSGTYEIGANPTIDFQWAYTRPIQSQSFAGNDLDVNITTQQVTVASTPDRVTYHLHAVSTADSILASLLRRNLALYVYSRDPGSSQALTPEDLVTTADMVGTSEIVPTVTYQADYDFEVLFLPKIYFGSSKLEQLSNAQILALNSEFVNENVADRGKFAEHLFNTDTGAYSFIAIPDNISVSKEFYLNGLNITDFEESVQNVTNAQGYSQDYKIFRFPWQTVQKVRLELK